MGRVSPLPVLFLVVLAASPAFPAQDAIGLYRAGSEAQAAENYLQAIENYKTSLDLNPSYLAPMLGLTECFFLLEEYDEASRWAALAEKYDRGDPNLQVLEGRIRIGQGDISGARSLFQGVLSRQPNNIEARFGMAEANVAEGRIQEALSQYGQTLAIAPESIKALLSLAVLSDAAGDQASAARYFDLALRGHADDPQVELAAGKWYAEQGSFDSAEKRAKIALSLKPTLTSALLLLGSIYLQTARYPDAVDAYRQVVSANRDDTLAWYGLGIAYSKSGDTAKAISSLSTGLLIQPQDEVARIAEETIALDSLKMDDPQRKNLASYHFTLGKQLEDRSYQDRALAEYRRALLLDPTSRDDRVSYAGIYRAMGFPAKYLNELEVLAKLGVKDTFVNDQIETFTGRLTDSVSKAWVVDQFALERKKYTIPVFTIPSSNRLIHPQAGDLLARYFTDILLRYESIAMPSIPPAVSSFDEAFRIARERASDYFLVLSNDESERSFSAVADLYLARTGTRIASYPVFRTGNDRVRDAFIKICAQLASALPLRATLLTRRFDQGLIDLGSFQGLKKDDALVVVRHDRVNLDPRMPGLVFGDADVIGNYVVQATDEGVSEGLLARKGYFDFINPGDEVVFPLPQKPQAPPQPAPRSGNILTRIFGIRG
jgi:tetratricopeptide (TPR) repeat protein